MYKTKNVSEPRASLTNLLNFSLENTFDLGAKLQYPAKSGRINNDDLFEYPTLKKPNSKGDNK